MHRHAPTMPAAHSRQKVAICTDYPCPAGYYWYYFSDPDCPTNPDSYEAYVQYWDADETFEYDVDVGHSTYDCNVYKGETLSGNPTFQNCENTSPWNCEQLGVSNDPHP